MGRKRHQRTALPTPERVENEDPARRPPGQLFPFPFPIRVCDDRRVGGEPVGTLLGDARSAFERGEFATARQLLEAIPEADRGAEALDALGQCLWFLGQIDAGIAHREAAYTACRRSGAASRAAEIALWLVVEYATSLGNLAAASGWYRRAERILVDAPLCPAHAQLEVHRGLNCADPQAALEHFERAADIGRRLGDPDSEVRGLSQIGFLKVVLGDLDDGLALLDETMTAATGGELRDPWAIGATCCSMLFACERIADLKRADEWCQVVFDLTSRRRYVPLSALCRSIYAGVLITSGDWPRAEAELLTALDTFGGLGRPLAAYPLARMAGLRIRQGRLEEAEELIAGWESHPEMARVVIELLLERGQYTLAAARLDHQLKRLGADSPQAVSLLPLLVELHLAQAAPEAAQHAADAFVVLARRLGHEHLRALSDLAAARAGAAPDQPAAVARLESAVATFSRLGMPYDEARAHAEIAALVAEREPELAIAEGRTALRLFEGLGSTRAADRAAGLLRSLGERGRRAPKRPGELSAREREVLALIEHGFSNRQIADRLYISPKTASHHVSQILTKLDVRSRAEAAAFSARERAHRSVSE